MSKVQSFRYLILFQRALNLALEVNKKTQIFPQVKIYGLTSQMRRTAYSIPPNIVEGHARNTRKDFLRFLNIANISLEELKYFTLPSNDLNYLNNTCYDELNKI